MKQTRRWLSLALLASLAATACSREARSSGEAPFRALTFEEACARAKKEKKIIVLDLFASWCGPCKMLDQTTWADSEVRAWLSEHAIAIKIDGDKHRALAERFELHAFPTIVFAWHTGAEIGRIVGYRDAQQFLAQAKALLERAG